MALGDQHNATAESHSLWRAFARGIRDNVVAEVAVQVVRLGGFVVLARALQPSDFGLFRVLMVIGSLGMFANEAGVGDALIQRPELNADHEATGWWISLVLSLLSSGALFLCAPLVSQLMAMPELTVPTRVLCIALLFEGTAVIAAARLRRRLDFTLLAGADVVAEVGFLVVALALLFKGEHFWVLPGGLAARYCCHALTLWLLAPYVPRQLPRMRAAADLAGFTTSALGGRVLNIASSNADYILVGRLLGSSALGAYSMAWDLLRFIPDRLYKVIARVMLPLFCRLADRHEDAQLAKAYTGFIQYTGRVILPIVACAAVAAPQLIVGIYGEQWRSAAIPLRLLAPGLAMVGMRNAIGSIYYSKNRPNLDVVFHGSRLLLVVLTVGLTASWGLSVVSGAMSFTELVVSIAGQYLACRLIGVGMDDFFAACVPGAGIALICGVATWLGVQVANSAGVTGFAALPIIVAVPAVAFCCLEFGTARDMLRRGFGPAGRGLTSGVFTE